MTETSLMKQLFQRCLDADYIHVENAGDYAIQTEGNKLYLLFQWSDGKEDWKNNFDFAAKPYRDMAITWRCHRGFLRVWKSIEPYIRDTVLDSRFKQVFVVGYSHGAAIATLAHEYVWFNRPDLRPENSGTLCRLQGYGFGCPRVFFGRMPKELRKRWLTFFPVRNLNDIVTHVPPALFGFRHVASIVHIGAKGNLTMHSRLACVSAHYPDNYLLSLV